MTALTMEMPDAVVHAFRHTPVDFVKALRFAAASKWYAEGMISQEIAAELAGLDRTDFLLSLAREAQDVFTVDFEQLQRELSEPL